MYDDILERDMRRICYFIEKARVSIPEGELRYEVRKYGLKMLELRMYHSGSDAMLLWLECLLNILESEELYNYEYHYMCVANECVLYLDHK